MSVVKEPCTKSLWLPQGKVAASRALDRVVDSYVEVAPQANTPVREL
jgi:ABC-type polysaccharide/polyol phosphate transport system ATPase subunit